jgi:hypothetical protein
MRLLFRGIMFCVGFGVMLALELLLVFLFESISGRRMIPIGLGWVLFPVSLGLAAAASTERLQGLLTRNRALQNKLVRQIAVIVAAWVVGCFAVYYVMKPYGNYVSRDDWRNFMGWLLIPPSGLVFIAIGFQWARGKGPSR